MSEIKRRTVFIDNSDGYMRFHDWALVNHTLGMMMEPFCYTGVKWELNSPGSLQNYDPEESMHRIDTIQFYSLDRNLHILGDAVIGGTLMPRIGR